MRSSLVGTIIWSALAVANLHAGLTWKTLMKSETAREGAKEVVLRFPFINREEKPIEIESVRSGCGCISSELSTTAIKPGESGELKVTFTVGNRVGRQQKVISVLEKNAKAPTVLSVDIQLPEPLKIEPPSLEWAKADPRNPKTVVVKTADGIQIKGISASNSAITVKQEAAKDNGVTLTVNPGKAEAPLSALLRINYEGKSSGMVSIPIRVR